MTLAICTTIGVVAGTILAIIDRNSQQITAGFAGGVIAGVLAEYFAYIGIQFWDAFTSAF